MAEDAKKSLFREKSMEAIESPEVLNDYLRVTSPGVWVLLAAVIIFLIGVIAWGFLGHIDTTIPIAVISDGGDRYCLVPEEGLKSAVENKTVILEHSSLELSPAVLEPQVVTEDMNVYTILAGELSIGEIVYPIAITSELDEGVYSGKMVTETISPVSFLLN